MIRFEVFEIFNLKISYFFYINVVDFENHSQIILLKVLIIKSARGNKKIPEMNQKTKLKFRG